MLALSDIIQISVVVVAFMGIFIPRIFFRIDEKRRAKNEERQKPRLRLHCDENDEGIFTECTLSNDHDVSSLKIRVFNDGFTTAKNVQIKIKEFNVIDLKDNSVSPSKHSFLKLLWSYQDQREKLKLPLETKMDIQPKSYEDCDFIFIDKMDGCGYFVSDESDLSLKLNGIYHVTVVVSGDNILSKEYRASFCLDRNKKESPVKIIADFVLSAQN